MKQFGRTDADILGHMLCDVSIREKWLSVICFNNAAVKVKVEMGFQVSEANCMSVKVTWRRRQWHPTPVLLPGKSHGQRSLVGCSPWGHSEWDTTE